MPQLGGYDFSAPAEICTFNALLFDMDGTIIDSTAAIVKLWEQIGRDIGVDHNVILATSHGRRSIDVLGILDPSRANWEYVCAAEGAIPKKYGQDAVEIAGARDLLAKLEGVGAPWAIVTSGTRPLVGGWLDVMSLAQPEHLVTAELVARGKPDPACYRLGAKKLGFVYADDEATDDKILVLEDAPAGVRAGKAAGFKVVALATTHEVQQLIDAGADWIVQDMRSVTLAGWDANAAQVQIKISNALVKA
ncbi:hypothetical protein AAFC00_005562 [Neodothiora populina]|uniref:Uncharacterized protein n=1 Tax=Neodothiora populina TaxID=2781224 RepID=A0ABR3PLP0_9PEZI